MLEQIAEFDKRTATVIDQAARAYAQRFTEDELKPGQISGLLQECRRRKYVETQPLVFNDVFVAMQACGRSNCRRI